MSKPLVIFLNEVAGGRLLIKAAQDKAPNASYVAVVAPQNQPSVGQLFAPEERAEAARARVEVTLAILEEFGIEAIGQVLDPEYDLALGDAIRGHRADQVLLSCTYDFRYGLTRRDLLEWARITFSDVAEITHIPVRIEDDSISQNVTHTLVVANRTLTSEDLHERLLDRSDDHPHRYTIIAPAADDVSEQTVVRNLARLLAKLYRADIDATAQPMSPDPFDAVRNAIEHYRVDEILISTLSGEESHWLKQDLVGKVREITDKPVIHHEAGRPPEAVAAAVAEGEPVEVAEDSTAEKSEA